MGCGEGLGGLEELGAFVGREVGRLLEELIQVGLGLCNQSISAGGNDTGQMTAKMNPHGEKDKGLLTNEVLRRPVSNSMEQPH